MYTTEELQECAYVLGWGRKSIPKSRSGVRKKIIDWIYQLISFDETF